MNLQAAFVAVGSAAAEDLEECVGRRWLVKGGSIARDCFRLGRKHLYLAGWENNVIGRTIMGR